MPMSKAIPVLPAQNIAETVAFYSEHLGFTSRFQAEDYAVILQDEIEIHFWQSESVALAENSSCRIQVTDVNALYAHLHSDLIHPNAPLEDKEYGVREFAILDNNGNLIWFFQRPIP